MALRAPEPREAMRHVEDGLAVGAGDLDLRGINAVRRNMGRWRRQWRRSAGLVGPRVGLGMGLGSGHELGRQHLGQLAVVAGEFGDPRVQSQDLGAAGAADLHSAWGSGGLRLQWDWRRLMLLHHGGSVSPPSSSSSSSLCSQTAQLFRKWFGLD